MEHFSLTHLKLNLILLLFKKNHLKQNKPGIVMLSYNPNTQKIKAELLFLYNQPALHREFRVTTGYTAKLYFQKQK